jgi:hypothetical protein
VCVCSYGANSLSFRSNHPPPTTHNAFTTPLKDVKRLLGCKMVAWGPQGRMCVCLGPLCAEGSQGCSYGADSLSFHSNHTPPTTHNALTTPLKDLKRLLGCKMFAWGPQGRMCVCLGSLNTLMSQGVHMELPHSVFTQITPHRPHTSL